MKVHAQMARSLIIFDFFLSSYSFLLARLYLLLICIFTGRTPLHFSGMKGFTQIASLLMESGAGLDKQDNLGA